MHAFCLERIVRGVKNSVGYEISKLSDTPISLGRHVNPGSGTGWWCWCRSLEENVYSRADLQTAAVQPGLSSTKP